jgi:diguanylate cyclase (GGDEF)-like protein
MIRNITAKLRREYTDNRKILAETVFLILVSVLTIMLFDMFNLTEAFYEFTRNHEEYNLDEVVLALSVISLYLMIFVTRRFLELRRYIIKANTDALIGIFNRRKGSEIINDEMTKAKRRGNRVSLIMYDLDNFKKINDTLGHNIGDAVLKDVASLVDSEIRVRDSHIRWGGEEFIILCPDTDLDGATKIAERCRRIIDETEIVFGRPVTASFGVIEIKLESDLRDNIEILDKMLYKSKESGKNNVICSLADGCR